MRRPHVAIMVAAKRGRGLNLTAAEVEFLSRDDAVEEAAQQRITTQEQSDGYGKTGWDWRRIKP